jgi:flavin reductase (DIM6/NTAB) family NADH-FMN oxidoreductase RutF
VTAIAAGQEDYLHVMTANAVTSLSLDPLLVLFCVAKEARMVQHLRDHPTFSINMLRQGQADLSPYFAGIWKGVEPPHFEFVTWHGTARLVGCLAAVCCELYQMHEAGDHWIVLGRAVAVVIGDDPLDPLIFHAGRYRELQPEILIPDRITKGRKKRK